MQAIAVVGLDAVRVVTEVVLMCVQQELLHHVHQFQFLKHRKEDTLGYAANPRATVQGTVSTGLPWTLWVNQSFQNYVKITPYPEVHLKEEEKKVMFSHLM